MKTSLLLLLCVSLFLSSCNKEIIGVEEFSHDYSTVFYDGGVNILSSPIQTPELDWENQTTINITDGTSRILPWYSSATTNAPNFILEDYKKEDGWELLYNLCEYPGELGQNYLTFYNKFTGIIRNYYFLHENVALGTNGMWGIELSGSSAFLNNIGYFAEDVSQKKTDPLALSSNITMASATKAITRGWNVYDTEITYDPSPTSSSVNMRFTSYDQNIQDVSLTGDISLASEGTIVSTNSKNPVQDHVNNATKAIGNEAKSWIKGKVGTSDNTASVIKLAAGAVASIVSGGVTEIVSAGVNLLFGSFIGRKSSSTTTTQDIEFKTNGTLTMDGTFSSAPANNVSPAAGLLFPGTAASNHTLLPYYNKKLGVWNLENKPIISLPINALFASNINHDTGEYYRFATIDENSINVVLNPDILSEIDNYSVETDLLFYERFNNVITWNGSPTLFQGSFTNLYDDGETKISRVNYESYLGDAHYDNEPPPGEDDTEDSAIPTKDIHYYDNRYVVKVTVTIYPKAGYNQDPVVITRSYLPTIQLFYQY